MLVVNRVKFTCQIYIEWEIFGIFEIQCVCDALVVMSMLMFSEHMKF